MLDRTKGKKHRPCKVSEELALWITSKEVLEFQRFMTMKERCHQISLMTEPPLHISTNLLLRLYRRHKCVRRNASYKFNRRFDTEMHQTKANIDFLHKLLRHMRDERQIIFMDETSTHLWEKLKSFWMPKDDLIDVRLNRDRGSSITIIGGISTHFDRMKYITCQGTKAENFQKFL